MEGSELDIVGVGEIAERLRVPISTVQMWRRRGQLLPPQGTIGKASWWQWTDVESWSKQTGRPKYRNSGSG